jgi:hypothetical protein
VLGPVEQRARARDASPVAVVDEGRGAAQRITRRGM